MTDLQRVAQLQDLHIQREVISGGIGGSGGVTYSRVLIALDQGVNFVRRCYSKVKRRRCQGHLSGHSIGFYSLDSEASPYTH